jgi:hypothetical protein
VLFNPDSIFFTINKLDGRRRTSCSCSNFEIQGNLSDSLPKLIAVSHLTGKLKIIRIRSSIIDALASA